MGEDPLDKLEKSHPREEDKRAKELAEKCDFRKKKSQTLRWVYSTVKTALEDSEVDAVEARKVAQGAIEEYQTGKETKWSR